MAISGKNKAMGFTLIELMVALVINLFILAVLTGIFIANLNHYTTAISINRLNQQLQAAMQLMVTDIRRAGYWANAATLVGTDTNTNPFQATATDITVFGGSTSGNVTTGNCILFTYDHHNTGSLTALSTTADDDRYGYRLSGTTLQIRPWGASYSCSAASSAWQNLTDSTIQVTTLRFVLTTQNVTTGLGTSGLNMRSVDITLTGQLASDTSITKTLTAHVRINNDEFVP